MHLVIPGRSARLSGEIQELTGWKISVGPMDSSGIAKYLEETGQMKPEVMAKAELLMTTGYQRQLTFRRSDGSFSAFGQNDAEGSLFLTAFVLKTFSQAKGVIYVDPQVLSSAQGWIIQHQNADGSFDPVGFVHHKEMMGGLTGKNALTAYVPPLSWRLVRRRPRGRRCSTCRKSSHQ